jgi:hypothetical protein
VSSAFVGDIKVDEKAKIREQMMSNAVLILQLTTKPHPSRV